MRRPFRRLATAGLLALCATAAVASGAAGSTAAFSSKNATDPADIPDGPGGLGHLAPLVVRGLRPPVPFEATDGKTHLTYVVTIQNAGPVPVKIDRISVLDATGGKVISTVAGKALESRLGLLSSPIEPLKNATLQPSQAGAYWVDATLPAGAPIPKELEHRLTATPIGKSFYKGTDTVTAAPLAVSRAKPIRLRPPLEGPGWVDLTGCCTGVPNHRHALFASDGRLFASQEFAIDFMRFGPGDRLFVGDPSDPADYFGYGAPVLAVADATVVAVSDHMEDQVPLDPKPVSGTEADGNFIMLDLGGGHYANYAHLAPGSITVKVGERVKVGEQMALVGNTGQTGVPHLHFHVMDRPQLAEANGLPFEFKNFKVEGVAEVDSIDRATSAGTRTKVKPVGVGRHRDELPLELTVTNFPQRNPSATASTAPAASGDFSGMVGIGGGRKLFLKCRGTGSPTVVLIAGAHGAYDDWTHVVTGPAGATRPSQRAVFPRVAKFAHVCAYDRPGTVSISGVMSASTPVRQPTTAQDGVADLHALLGAAGVNGPYVLVAHSWGGMIGQLYARTYLAAIDGLVLLDPGSQYLKTTLKPRQWNRFARAARKLGEPKTLEAAAYEPSIKAILAAPPVPPVPSEVLSSDHPFPFGAGGRGTWPVWLAAQNQLAADLGARHIAQTDSGHYIAGERPGLVVAAIRRVWLKG